VKSDPIGGMIPLKKDLPPKNEHPTSLTPPGPRVGTPGLSSRRQLASLRLRPPARLPLVLATKNVRPQKIFVQDCSIQRTSLTKSVPVRICITETARRQTEADERLDCWIEQLPDNRSRNGFRTMPP